MQRGARGACSHCVRGTKTGTGGARTDGQSGQWPGEPLCPAPAPRILHLVSPYNFVPRLMVRGIFLNICNGRQSRDAGSHWSRRARSHTGSQLCDPCYQGPEHKTIIIPGMSRAEKTSNKCISMFKAVMSSSSRCHDTSDWPGIVTAANMRQPSCTPERRDLINARF